MEVEIDMVEVETVEVERVVVVDVPGGSMTLIT